MWISSPNRHGSRRAICSVSFPPNTGTTVRLTRFGDHERLWRPEIRAPNRTSAYPGWARVFQSDQPELQLLWP